LDLCNGIAKEGCIPEDSKSSAVLPINKQNGESKQFVSYRGIKLLEHAMKVVERIIECRIQQQIHTYTQRFYGSLDFVRNNPGEPVLDLDR